MRNKTRNREPNSYGICGSYHLPMYYKYPIDHLPIFYRFR